MILGHTLFAEVASGVANPTVVYTPWMPRRRNNAIVTYVAEAIGGQARVSVDVLEKDSDETGDGTAKTGDPSANTSAISTGTNSYRVTDCKELARFRVTLQISTEPSGTKLMFVHFRILSPSWETTGAQGV